MKANQSESLPYAPRAERPELATKVFSFPFPPSVLSPPSLTVAVKVSSLLFPALAAPVDIFGLTENVTGFGLTTNDAPTALDFDLGGGPDFAKKTIKTS
jgi:hypothetical protein